MFYTLTEADFAHLVGTNPLAVVLFSASWCEKCPAMMEFMEKKEVEHPTIPFFAVDIDELPVLKERARIKAVPMVLFYRGGRVRDFLWGIPDEEKFQRKIDMQIKVVEGENATKATQPGGGSGGDGDNFIWSSPNR